MHDAADKLALALVVGGAPLGFLMLTIGYRYDSARRRRRRAGPADSGGVPVADSATRPSTRRGRNGLPAVA